MEITSGEALYRTKNIGDERCRDLKAELTGEIDRQLASYNEKLNEMRNLRRLSRSIASERMITDVSASVALLTHRKNEILDKLSILIQKHEISVDNMKDEVDAGLMKWILQYFSILKNDMMRARSNLHNDHTVYELGASQVKMHRDMMNFSYSLKTETKAAVNLSSVAHDSTQYKRCRKAVMDSIGSSFDRKFPGCSGINVINVYKLEHIWLSSNLQDAAAAAESAKVKGLFCVIPKENVYGVCTYGLHIQNIEGLPAAPSINETFGGHADARNARQRRALFSPPWFTMNNTENDADSHHINKRSLSPATLTPKGREYGHAKKLADACTLQEPRFSRSSAPMGMGYCDERGKEKGVYLALCRVLINRLRLIDGPISPEIVRDSFQLGYDAIYSTPLEEYVLLKPTHVLPEFIMHVQLMKDEKEKEGVQQKEGSPISKTKSKIRPPTPVRVPGMLHVSNPVRTSVRREHPSDAAKGNKDVFSLLLENEVIAATTSTTDFDDDIISASDLSPKTKDQDRKNDKDTDIKSQTHKIDSDMDANRQLAQVQRESMIIKQNVILNVQRAAESFLNSDLLSMRNLIYDLESNIFVDNEIDGT
jgi:hypothetical protein